MSIYQVTISKSYLISTDDRKNDIEVNIDNYIDKGNLLSVIIESGDLSEVFDTRVIKKEDLEELVCLNCEEPITELELRENGQYCDDCSGELDEEDIEEIP